MTPSYKRKEGPNGRFYDCGNGNWYPSVTTFLSRMLDKSGLDEWRKRVGDEAANRISKQSTDRGTELHSYCEHYLQGLDFTPKYPMVKTMFKTIKPYLDKITDVKGLEKSLHSDKLKLAGTADCIATYDGLPAIIDFKNSNSMKSKDDILGYFLQTSIYAVMWKERTGLDYPNLVIIMATEQNRPLLFVEHARDYLPTALKLLKDFHNERYTNKILS